MSTSLRVSIIDLDVSLSTCVTCVEFAGWQFPWLDDPGFGKDCITGRLNTGWYWAHYCIVAAGGCMASSLEGWKDLCMMTITPWWQETSCNAAVKHTSERIERTLCKGMVVQEYGCSYIHFQGDIALQLMIWHKWCTIGTVCNQKGGIRQRKSEIHSEACLVWDGPITSAWQRNCWLGHTGLEKMEQVQGRYDSE